VVDSELALGLGQQVHRELPLDEQPLEALGLDDWMERLGQEAPEQVVDLSGKSYY
jgi:hypothetical protein